MTLPRPGLALLAALALVTAAVAAADEPTLVWSNLLDGGASQTDDGQSVLVGPGGHPIVGGIRTGAHGYADISVQMLDRDTGQPLWTFLHHNSDGFDLALADLALDHRGDVLVAGYLSACDS